jgi:hypothetical protein
MLNLNVPVSQQFQSEAARLNVDPALLACWICEDFADNSPDSLAIPKALIPALSVAPTNPVERAAVA